MSIQKLENALDLRKQHGKEGLVFQGCGGDLQEWVDGVNNLLTEACILKNGAKFEQVTEFHMPGITCLLFPFEDMGEDLDVGKLAMWRLRTYDTFGAMWLSDYVENRLGGYEAGQEQKKPECPLIGANGNIFNIMGIAAKTLKRAGMGDAAKEMQDRVTSSGSYDEALAIISEYVEPVTAEEYAEQDESPELEGY
ncbi:MAG: hypothetical protein J5851_02570 [Oscillospiraceae bacterium]|nr:hypothetical protein [Oscillospiraceae bacterium]